MHPLFKKLLASRNLEYLELDGTLTILETSLGVQRLADCPEDAIAGNDVRLSFPELIGLEDILIAILEGWQSSFELKGINRSCERTNPLYIDMFIFNDSHEDGFGNHLIVGLEDVTARMVLEQTLVQKSNEASLLLEAWAESSEYLTQKSNEVSILLDAWAVSSQYLAKIITSMADALVITTPSASIKIVNPAAQDLFGYSQSELIGQPISLLMADSNFIESANPNHPSHPEFLNPVEVVCQTKTGEKITVTFSCSVIEMDHTEEQDVIYLGRTLPKC